jgi:hypothetical protein
MAPADRGLTASKSTAARAVCGVRCLRAVGSDNAVNRANPNEDGPVPDRPRRWAVPLARVGNRRTHPTLPGRVATSNALVCPEGSWRSAHVGGATLRFLNYAAIPWSPTPGRRTITHTTSPLSPACTASKCIVVRARITGPPCGEGRLAGQPSPGEVADFESLGTPAKWRAARVRRPAVGGGWPVLMLCDLHVKTVKINHRSQLTSTHSARPLIHVLHM